MSASTIKRFLQVHSTFENTLKTPKKIKKKETLLRCGVRFKKLRACAGMMGREKSGEGKEQRSTLSVISLARYHWDLGSVSAIF